QRVTSARAGGQRPSHSRRLGLALVLAVGIALIPATGQAGQRQAPPRLQREAVAAPRSVDLFGPADAASTEVSATPAPPLRPLAQRPRAKDTASVQTLGPAIAITKQSFPMMSRDLQVNRFKIDQVVS